MGLRVGGRNAIENHLLTLLDINLCIKSGLNTFSPPPRQVYLFKVTVYLYLGGGTKAGLCLTIGQIQNGVLSWFVEPKMERKYATEYSNAEKWASES